MAPKKTSASDGCGALMDASPGGRRTRSASPTATRSAKSSSPRDAKRSAIAVERIGAGTPSSMAALSVQRPSPESETRPANPGELRVSLERCGREIEQPRGDDAAAPPHLGDLPEIEVVLVELGIRQGRRLRVGGALLVADVGVPEDVEALGVRGHQPVLDSVVHHLHEVAGAARPAAQIAMLRRRGRAAASGRARGRVDGGSERSEDRVEPLHHIRVAADHLAVAALLAPDAAGGSDVDVVNARLTPATSRDGYRRDSTSSRRR